MGPRGSRFAPRAAHKWIIPRRTVLGLFALGTMLLFIGIVLLAIGAPGSGVLVIFGAILLTVGLILLIACLFISLYAYCVFFVRDTETQTTGQVTRVNIETHDGETIPAYAILEKASQGSMLRNGKTGGTLPKRVTIATEVDQAGRTSVVNHTGSAYSASIASPMYTESTHPKQIAYSSKTSSDYSVPRSIPVQHVEPKTYQQSSAYRIEPYNATPYSSLRSKPPTGQTQLGHVYQSSSSGQGQQGHVYQQDQTDHAQQGLVYEQGKSAQIQQGHVHQQGQTGQGHMHQQGQYGQIQQGQVYQSGHGQTGQMYQAGQGQQDYVYRAGQGQQGLVYQPAPSPGQSIQRYRDEAYATQSRSYHSTSEKKQSQLSQLPFRRHSDDDYDNVGGMMPLIQQKSYQLPPQTIQTTQWQQQTNQAYVEPPPAQPLVYPSAKRPMTFEQVSSSKVSIYDNVLMGFQKEIE